jgi:hypothetical protein
VNVSNVISLNRERAVRLVASEDRRDRIETLRATLLGLIETHADLPRTDLISEFTGCLVVIEAGAYGWRK